MNTQPTLTSGVLAEPAHQLLGPPSLARPLRPDQPTGPPPRGVAGPQALRPIQGRRAVSAGRSVIVVTAQLDPAKEGVAALAASGVALLAWSRGIGGDGQAGGVVKLFQQPHRILKERCAQAHRHHRPLRHPLLGPVLADQPQQGAGLPERLVLDLRKLALLLAWAGCSAWRVTFHNPRHAA